MTSTTPLTADALRRMPLPQPAAGSKEGRGQVLIVAGSVEVPGAALLAATAALRAGAGKLQVATVAGVAPHLGIAVPESMVIGLRETADGGMEHRAAAERLGPKAERADAVLVGPGMAEGGDATSLTAALLSKAPSRSFALDAASLVDLQRHADVVRSCEGRVVITPHAGEMAQLLDRSREEVEADPLDAARTASAMLRAVVIMKGAETQIVDPDGGAWTYAGGGVGLATSGSGDILAGILVGLLARGAEPSRAALWAVFLHGDAGARLARAQGPLGFLARELAGQVPAILRDLEADV